MHLWNYYLHMLRRVFLILYLAAKISREPPEQLGAVPYPQADQTPAQNVSVKCGMGRAFPRRGRFQPYGWTCEWHKIDVIILSKSTDSISRDWTRVFATAFASQAKFRGGGAVRLFAIHFEWCCSLNTSLVWMRFVVCILWTVTALIFLLQGCNHQGLSSHLPCSLIFGEAATPACQLSFQIGCISLEQEENILAEGLRSHSCSGMEQPGPFLCMSQP